MRAATPAPPVPVRDVDGNDWVIDGAKAFITNSGTDDHLGHHRHGAHRRRHLDVRDRSRHTRADRRTRLRQARLARERHARIAARRLPGAGREPAGRAGRGFPQLPVDPRRWPHRHLGARARLRPSVPRDGGRLREGAAGLRWSDRPEPGHCVPAGRPRRRRGSGHEPHLSSSVAEGPGPSVRAAKRRSPSCTRPKPR